MKCYKQKLTILFNNTTSRKLITVYSLYYFFTLVKNFLPRTLEIPLLVADASFTDKHFSCRPLYSDSASFVFPSISFSSS